MTDRAFDLVLLEQTFGDVGAGTHETDHLDLTTFPSTLAALRSVRAINDSTEVVAVHLGHRNPPLPRLAQRLGRWGASVVPDLTVLTVGGPPLVRLPRPEPRRTLVLGGARSGKSRHAQQLLAAEPDVIYVATGPLPTGVDLDWDARVRRHRQDRPATWTTLETRDLAQALRQATSPVLVDCMATWLTAVMDDAGAWTAEPGDDGWVVAVEGEIDRMLVAWRAAAVPVVAVSNEVGSGVAPATRSGGLFRDALGRLNQRLADTSEDVRLVVAGRVQRLGDGDW